MRRRTIIETYPFTFKASERIVEELHGAEYGSYEDALYGCSDRDIKHHTVTIIERRKAKTGITVECLEEVKDLEYSIRTGLAGDYVNLDKLHDAVLDFMNGNDPYSNTKEPLAPTVKEEQWNEAVQEVIDMAVGLKLVKRPVSFRKKVRVELCRGRSGHGGGRNIVVQCGRHFNVKRKIVREYARIDKDKEIGGFIPRSEADVLFWLATHEAAHAIDHWNYYQGVETTRDHGSEWRHIYRQIRRAFGMVRGEDGYLMSTINA